MENNSVGGRCRCFEYSNQKKKITNFFGWLLVHGITWEVRLAWASLNTIITNFWGYFFQM